MTGHRRWFVRGLLVLASTVFALLAAEVAVRFMGRTDADGNFVFRGRVIGRRHPPVAAVEKVLRRYRNSTSSRMVYDRWTGWKPRADSVSHGGIYRYNSRGIRGPREYPPTPPPGVLRIALCGDSFTHGDDVPFEDTWGARLEAALNEAGLRAEVINFGVSAYGMDQAYLRWRHLGRRFSPDVVLFGFQAENVNRNVNLLRGFYAGGTGVPFSKPRFVLDGDGTLRLINSPTLPLRRIPEVMADMESWKLAPFESFYDPDRYRRRFWHSSRLVSLAVQARDGRTASGPVRLADPYRLDGEPARVTLALLRRFRDDVQGRGRRFVIVHLPKRSDLRRAMNGRSLPYAALLERVRTEHTLIDPQSALLAAARNDSLDALFQRHYSPRAGTILGRVVADFLLTRRETLAPSSETGPRR